ncbi:MAG: hypothetical protein CVV27_17515 [Candidatus Melainabacteria bacterium HGW-Melainabacteria-1]|nr:MAG: hypothetical protein CVV27_17515 [Candidatus Melainabacteria bacterium HGW-Melainabacteria-1]
MSQALLKAISLLLLIPAEAPTSCQALPIQACRRIFSGVEGRDVYRCFDAAGNTVAEAPTENFSARYGCPNAQVLGFLKAYAEPCAFRARLEEVDSPLRLLLDATKLDRPVCYNLDRSRVSFSDASTRYLLETEQTPAGGNARGSYWTLQIQGGPPALLQTQVFPFLACESFSARHPNAWQLKLLRKNAERFTLSANNVAFPNRIDFNWDSELKALSKRFTGCPVPLSAS